MIPPPTPPPSLELEDVDSIPDQLHDWGESWDGDTHGGRICKVCETYSACTWCDSTALDDPDCLREQADNRNQVRLSEHRTATVRYEAQMDYYREITKGSDT